MNAYRMRSSFEPENDAPLVGGERLLEVPYEVGEDCETDESGRARGSTVADNRAA